jgi:pyruvate dehydrogenase E1 component alpha subunit
VVFVCENNLYMEYTPIAAVTAVQHPAADRAAAYGLDRILVDGNDPEAMYAIARSTIQRARKGGGPSLVEAVTYRHGGHSRADPAKYRPEAEVKEWLARDPGPSYRAALEAGGVDQGAIVAIEQEVGRRVDEATEIAKASPSPAVGLIQTDVWSDGGSSWRN